MRTKKLNKRFQMLQMIAELQRMRRDEKGGITVLTLILLLTMLVMSGMAVDFMRYETERVKLQSVSDRAVLAAADLSADNPQAIVTDFFKTAGYENMMGTPTMSDPKAKVRSVQVASEVSLDTFYLRLVGIDRLQAPAMSRAIEGVGRVEVALVLDISGSMRFNGVGGDPKIDTMRVAARDFARTILSNAAEKSLDQAVADLEAAEDNGALPSVIAALKADVAQAEALVAVSEPNEVSLTIVPYAGSVNPGPEMFDYLNGVRFGQTVIDAGDEHEDYKYAIENTYMSSCLELASGDFDSTGLPGTGLPQIAHFMNWNIGGGMDWGWCPQDQNSVQWAISDRDVADRFLENVRMHDGTGTMYGMKYALASLDPDTRPAFEQMSTTARYQSGTFGAPVVDEEGNPVPTYVTDSNGQPIMVLETGLPLEDTVVPEIHADRPYDWDDEDTRKIIVLMTDGKITEQVRPDDPFDPANANNALNNRKGDRVNEWSQNGARANFRDLCALAIDPADEGLTRNDAMTAILAPDGTPETPRIEVFTIAFETGNDTDLRECATLPETMHFSADGDELIEIFKKIASQITDLRLDM